MLTEARLMTPEGRTIIISAADYYKVIETLAIRWQAPSRPPLSELRSLVREVHGKYASDVSLTESLLDERRREREREDAKLRHHAHA